MRGVFVFGLGLFALSSVFGEPVAVLSVAERPEIDGILTEWGAPERISIVPGGDRVGVRGAFNGETDHEADIYLMWDADHIYIAVVVIDDIADIGRIAPGKNVWRGPSGERKDIMFYYDHLKIFLRGPDRPLGHSVWLSPAAGSPYLWGGMQRGKNLEQIPIEAGGAMRDSLYTFEVAIPWIWLDFYPQPDMVLDALFLLPDSDLPGQEVRKKVDQSNKWIWWKGRVQLKGRPPGLREPKKTEVIEEIARQSREIVVPKVEVAPEPEPEKSDPVEERVLAGRTSPDTLSAAVDEGVDTEGEVAAQSVSVTALRARLNRHLLAREARVEVAPAWIRELNDDRGVSGAQVDSLYHRLAQALQRLTDSRINTRTDGLVIDLAEYAGTWRAQAQYFLQKLLEKILADIQDEEGSLPLEIARAAAEVDVDGAKALKLVRTLCRQTLEVYLEGKVALSETLIDKARRRAGLSKDEAQSLLVALVREKN